jgi:hypothetical protein
MGRDSRNGRYDFSTSVATMDARTEQQVKHIPPVRWTRKTVKRYAQAYRVIYARENFARFRQYMRPNMMWGWWNQIVADELQLFYEAIGRYR